MTYNLYSLCYPNPFQLREAPCTVNLATGPFENNWFCIKPTNKIARPHCHGPAKGGLFKFGNWSFIRFHCHLTCRAHSRRRCLCLGPKMQPFATTRGQWASQHMPGPRPWGGVNLNRYPTVQFSLCLDLFTWWNYNFSVKQKSLDFVWPLHSRSEYPVVQLFFSLGFAIKTRC